MRTAIRHFLDDDEGYFTWLAGNAQGYVINCHANPRPTYLVLHRADCRHIQSKKRRRATCDYCKVCATEEQALQEWATTLGGSLARCRFCEP